MNKLRALILLILFIPALFLCKHITSNVFTEAESFSDPGGWVVDQESRRLMGDVILREQDLVNRVGYPDASFTTTWGIDLHYPVKSEGFDGEPFRSVAETVKIDPYAVPYRCLYSRNISNMFMAGRCISVTHVALGSVRVMRTGGMMGEVVGMAASVCKNNNTLPRDVYNEHLGELKKLMSEGVPQKN